LISAVVNLFFPLISSNALLSLHRLDLVLGRWLDCYRFGFSEFAQNSPGIDEFVDLWNTCNLPRISALTRKLRTLGLIGCRSWIVPTGPVCPQQLSRLQISSQQMPIETKFKARPARKCNPQLSYPRPPSPTPSSFLHAICILLLLCFPECGREAANSSFQSPKSY
jgi:hypothetical protein